MIRSFFKAVPSAICNCHTYPTTPAFDLSATNFEFKAAISIKMPFSFSFSTSATIVSTSSVNGETKGWAYKRESRSNNNGSHVRTTTQTLGDAPETKICMYDAQGRRLLTNDDDTTFNNQGSGSRSYNNGYVSQRRANNNIPVGKIISIEDVTDEENAKAAANAQQWNNTQGKN